MKQMSNPKPKYEMGDLVMLDGNYFVVDGYHIEHIFEQSKEFQSIYYLLFSVHPCGNPLADNVVAYEEDLIFITDSGQTEFYIKDIIPKTVKENKNMSAAVYDYGGDRKKNSKKKTNVNKQKQLEKQELKRRKNFKIKMDKLLDELSDAMKKNDHVRKNKVQGKLHNLSIIHKAGGYVKEDEE